MIAEGRGRHFDPDVADAMLAIAGEFRDIARRFVNASDNDGSPQT